MEYITKVLLSTWIVGSVALFFGVAWTLGLNKIILISTGKRLRLAEIISGIIALAIGFGATIPLTLDYIENNPQELTVYVEGRTHSLPLSIVKNDIVTKEHGTFSNMFYEFDVRQNGYYKIKYLPRSTTLTYAERIK